MSASAWGPGRSSVDTSGLSWWYAPLGLVLVGLLPLGVFSELSRFHARLPLGLPTIIVELFLLAVAFGLLRLRGPVSRSSFALRPMRITPGRAGLWIALGLLGVLIVDAFYIGLFRHVGHPTLYRQTPTGAGAWLIAFAGVIAAPISEELFFRGILHRALRTRMRAGLAIAISASVFGLMHWWYGDPIGTVFPRVMAGVLLALLLERTGSLYPGMFAHALFNLSVAAWALPGWGPKIFLLAPLAWFIAILVSLEDPRRKRNQQSAEESRWSRSHDAPMRNARTRAAAPWRV